MNLGSACFSRTTSVLRTLLVFPEAPFPFPLFFSCLSFCFFSLVFFRRCSRSEARCLRISSSSSLLPASSSAFRPFLNDAIFACSFSRISDILPLVPIGTGASPWTPRSSAPEPKLSSMRPDIVLSRSRSSPEASSSSSRFRFLDSSSRFAASACKSRMDLLFAGSS